MRVPALALLSALGLAVSVGSANSAPAVPAIPVPGHSNIVQIAGGCGADLHRNNRGFCVRNPAYQPYAYYGGGNEFLNQPSPSDHAANWLNGQEARRGWGHWGY